MGVYDEIVVGTRSGQVKCWINQMRTFTVGDSVSCVGDVATYSLAMREGGYLYVRNNVITGWEDTPIGRGTPTFDKYGNEFTGETQGALSEVMTDTYFFEKGY